jgi:asparagine synthase (glutamine-hydrolysing)
MCGFACLIDPARIFDPSLISAIDQDLYHRGPDSGGTAIEAGFALIFRRLAIMDPETIADQPMSDPSGRVTLVFNGEIYNFLSLKFDLEQKGHVFRTKGDTEVILEGYLEWGLEVFNKLEGMYTIGLIDRKEAVFYGARDPLGIKPLYVARSGTLTAISSEVGPLTRLVGAEVDNAAIPELLTFGWAAGRTSNYKGIDRLPGGTCIRVDLTSGHYSEHRFCDPLDTLRHDDHTTALDAQQAVIQSLDTHLMSDVGFAMQLSGGVDSSLLTALAASKSDTLLSTFAVKVSDAAYDEGPYRAPIIQKYNLDHTEHRLDGEEFANDLPKAIQAMEGPVPHGGCVGLFGLCREIQKSHKVVLTGEGADEMFGGYMRYAIGGKLRAQEWVDQRIPNSLPLPSVWPFKSIQRLRNLDRAVYASVYGDLDQLSGLFPDLVPAPPGFRESVSARFTEFRDRLFAVDQTSYLESLLVRQDKMSMAHSVEARVPFVHMPLLRCVNSLSNSIRAPGGMTKPVLKQLAEKYLDRNLVHRRKNGLLLPYQKWVKETSSLGRFVDLLEDNNARIRTYANTKKLNYRLESLRSGKIENPSEIFGLINLELWLRSVQSLSESVQRH